MLRFLVILLSAVASSKWHVSGIIPPTNFKAEDVDSFLGIKIPLRNSFPIFDLYNAFGNLGTLNDVRFLLWTRSNYFDNGHYNLQLGNITNLALSPFLPSLPTYFIFHGYADNGKNIWILKAKTALLQLHDCNVISVDWYSLVIHPWYLQATRNSFLVGNYTAGMIDWLNERTGVQPHQIHIIGHSLGAHAAGFTGMYCTCGEIGRITGLDPAGPLFYFKDARHRIDKSHASYVDIIHSNSGQILQGCYGLFEAVGDADFYPNGGKHQPGCLAVNKTIWDDLLDLMHNCSHARVTDLWVESIGAMGPSNMFTSWPCHDYDQYVGRMCTSCDQGCPRMGFHVDKSMKGTFYLRTHKEPPYAQGNLQ